MFLALVLLKSKAWGKCLGVSFGKWTQREREREPGREEPTQEDAVNWLRPRIAGRESQQGYFDETNRIHVYQNCSPLDRGGDHLSTRPYPSLVKGSLMVCSLLTLLGTCTGQNDYLGLCTNVTWWLGNSGASCWKCTPAHSCCHINDFCENVGELWHIAQEGCIHFQIFNNQNDSSNKQAFFFSNTWIVNILSSEMVLVFLV